MPQRRRASSFSPSPASPWTALRNGFYAHGLNWLIGTWRQTGVITVPADGPVSWTAREDAAAAAAIILVSNGAYEGPTTLTASTALTFEQIATIASELNGRTTERVVVDHDERVATQVAAGSRSSYLASPSACIKPPRRATSPESIRCSAHSSVASPRTVAGLLAQPTAN